MTNISKYFQLQKHQMEMVTKLKVDEINKQIDNVMLAMSILFIHSMISILKWKNVCEVGAIVR